MPVGEQAATRVTWKSAASRQAMKRQPGKPAVVELVSETPGHPVSLADGKQINISVLTLGATV
jgi:hypothetical protein